MSAKEKQAAAEQTFVFPALLTSKHPAKAGHKVRKHGLASEYDIIAAGGYYHAQSPNDCKQSLGSLRI